MLGMTSKYNSTEHTIIRGEISRWLKRLVKGDPRREGRLFLVRYNKLGVFCICEWMNRPFGAFVDIMNLGKSLANFGRDESIEMRQRFFKPLTAEATKKILIKADSDFHHNLQDEDMEETERQELVAIGE